MERFYNVKGTATEGIDRLEGFRRIHEFLCQNNAPAVLCDAIAYERDTIIANREKAASKRGSTSTGEHKSPLDSDLGQAIVRDIVPMLTSDPQTLEELCNAATAKGLVSPKGTPYPTMWVGRILGLLEPVKKVPVIRTKTTKKTVNGNTVELKADVPVSGYCI